MDIFVLILRKGRDMKGRLARDTYTKYNWHLHSLAFWGKGGLKLIIGKFDNRCVSWQIYIKRSQGNYPLKRVVFLCALGTVQSSAPLFLSDLELEPRGDTSTAALDYKLLTAPCSRALCLLMLCKQFTVP